MAQDSAESDFLWFTLAGINKVLYKSAILAFLSVDYILHQSSSFKSSQLLNLSSKNHGEM